MRESRWLLASLAPLAAYEAVALRTRKVPTITSAVRTAPRWVKLPLGIALAVGFSHLFFGKP